MKRVVIVHPKMGVFIGVGLGFAFFTLSECAGQTVVAVFDNEAQARLRVSSWDSANNPDDYQYLTVDVPEEYADTLALLAAGVPRHMVEPLMFEEARSIAEQKAEGKKLQ